MNKPLDLTEKSYLENRILNPIDRSLGRFNDIYEYVKQHAKREYWEEINDDGKPTKRRQVWIHLHLPKEVIGENSDCYSECVEYKEGQETEKKMNEKLKNIAEQIFKDY